MTQKRTAGKISYNNVKPWKHERQTALFLAEKGYNIRFIPPSNAKGVHTPDIVVNNDLAWEIKSLRTSKESTIKHSFSSAIKQSANIIFDLRALTNAESHKAQQLITKIFSYFRAAKRLIIITKDNQLIKLSK